jgi:hypothetical protein
MKPSLLRRYEKSQIKFNHVRKHVEGSNQILYLYSFNSKQFYTNLFFCVSS